MFNNVLCNEEYLLLNFWKDYKFNKFKFYKFFVGEKFGIIFNDLNNFFFLIKKYIILIIILI